MIILKSSRISSTWGIGWSKGTISAQSQPPLKTCALMQEWLPCLRRKIGETWHLELNRPHQGLAPSRAVQACPPTVLRHTLASRHPRRGSQKISHCQPPIATKYDLQSHPEHTSSAFYSSTAPKLKHFLIYEALVLTFVFQSMCQARVWRRNVFSLRRGRALPPTINNH